MRSRVRPLDVPALEARVRAFEEKYSLPSDRMFEAFTVDGVLHETDDFRDWCFDHETLLAVRRALLRDKPE